MAANQPARIVFCKRYHRAIRSTDRGLMRAEGDRKSRCPGWASDAAVQQRLLIDALPDPDGQVDVAGRPKRLWNAVAGWYFVAVSTNEAAPRYNCYPESPATGLVDQLSILAKRSVEEVLR